MTIYELNSNIVEDEMELGLRVATALYVENETDSENFIRILKFKDKFGRR